MMGHRIGYSAQGRVNPKDFGMNFRPVLDGNFVVANEIDIFVEGEIVEQKQEPSASAGGSPRHSAVYRECRGLDALLL
jgi:hypothetical protein